MGKIQNITIETDIEDIPFTENTVEEVILSSPKKVTPLEIIIAEELPWYTNEKTSFIIERKTDSQTISLENIQNPENLFILNKLTSPTENVPELYSLASGSLNERYSPLDEEIGKHFKLKHLISYDYNNPLYYELNNYPGVDKEMNGEKIIQNLKDLVENCIDKIMVKYPSLILLSSYRSLELNRMIGGSHDNNSHIKGCAIDFKVSEEYTSYIFNWCIENLDTWHELMWAYPERGNQSWIHISYKKNKPIRLTTLASEREDIHNAYGGSRRGTRGEYQEGITKALQNLV